MLNFLNNINDISYNNNLEHIILNIDIPDLSNISTIDLSYETTDTIEEFTVEFQVHWWEAFKGSGANAGGENIS